MRTGRRSSRLLFLLGVVLALARCGGTAPGTPGDLTVSSSDDFDRVLLSWTAPAGGAEGYRVQGRVGSSDFQTLAGLVSGPTAAVDLSPSTPEETDLDFRVLAVRGSSESAPSNVAHMHRGLRPADSLSAEPVANGEIALAWTGGSAVADRIVLERAAAPDGGAAPVWASLVELVPGTTSSVDGSPDPEGIFLYRLRFAKGSEQSPWRQTASTTGVLVAPSGLSAEGQPTTITLTWTDHGHGAAELVVLRAAGAALPGAFTEIAHLAPDATSLVDAVPASGLYAYRVVARTLRGTAASTAPVFAGTSAVTGSLVLAPSFLTMPAGPVRAQDGQGSWFVAGGQYGPDSVFRQSGGVWVSKTFAVAATRDLALPVLQVDAAAHPHVMFLREVIQGGSTFAVTHDWFDGVDWQEEELFRQTVANSYGANVTFAVDSSAGLHVIWSSAPTSHDMAYVHRQGGSWVFESLDVVSPEAVGIGPVKLLLDAAGNPNVLLGASARVVHLSRGAGGAWSSEDVPTGPVSAGPYDFLGGVIGASSDLSVFSEYDDVTTYELHVEHEAAGLWGAPEILGSRPFSTAARAAVAIDRPGGRIAATYALLASDGLLLLVNGGQGWNSTVLPASGMEAPTLGFDPTGRLYVLQRLNESFDGQGHTQSLYVLYTEQR